MWLCDCDWNVLLICWMLAVSRSKMMAMKSVSKMRGNHNQMMYPQPEGQLGDCMLKYGRDLGDDSLFGECSLSIQQITRRRSRGIHWYAVFNRVLTSSNFSVDCCSTSSVFLCCFTFITFCDEVQLVLLQCSTFYSVQSLHSVGIVLWGENIEVETWLDCCVAGQALVESGEGYKQLADVKYALENSVKQNFIEPLQQLQSKEIKEVNVSCLSTSCNQ